MNRLTLLSLILSLIAFSSASNAAGEIEERPILLPTPKKIAWLNGRISLATNNRQLTCIVDTTEAQNAVVTGISQVNEKLSSLCSAEIPVVTNDEAANGYGTVIWIGTQHELLSRGRLLGEDFILPGEMCVQDGYVLRCIKNGKRNIIICAGFDARGCYYGLQTLIQLMSADKGTVSIPRVDIIDWPTYKIRLVKIAGSTDNPANVTRWVNLLPGYKMNVFGSHFTGGKASGSWRKPSQIFQQNTRTIGNIGKATDTFDPMLYMGPFGEDRGSLLDPKLIGNYTNILNTWISKGYKHVVVDFNDWGIYDKLSDDEKKHFKDIGEVMSWLTNETYSRIHDQHPEVGILVVPGWPHYLGTPQPDLIFLCKSLPKDVMVMTTGYRTRSTDITAKWLKDWATKTGRKPFLWDNTLYSHLDRYRPLVNGIYNFDAYQVQFPENMPDLLAGPGIHLNGYAYKIREPGVLTFLDYAWNPEAYDAKRSLRNAQILLWGKDAPGTANEAQQFAIELYEYLFNISTQKNDSSKEEALRRYAELEKALKRLTDIIGDPVVSNEAKTYCLGKATTILESVFPSRQPIKTN